ncbi:MAG TPA: hypothetical protein VH583_11115 [Vicinamibacterales bacterium]|jgi:hypothetical protein
MTKRIILFAALLAGLASVSALTAGRKFYDDDPIAREPESRDASHAAPLGIELFYEYAYNLFVTERHKPSNTRAGNVNTIDEVPDSGWFVNRIGSESMSAESVARGVNDHTPPAPERWVVLREKTAGTSPGFTARDANGQTWFLQFDPPEYPGASTADVEIATKLFWALGYNQVETFITTFDPRNVTIDPKATARRPSGERTPYTRDDMKVILERAAQSVDGTYRASAGRLLDGKVLGNFRYAGTRSDDPNDLVPHQHRRELRALRVFGAWANLVDLKAGNTLDALVEKDGRSVVRHYLQDVGSSLGMANDYGVWDMGWEYFYDAGPTKKRLFSFGFALSPWQTVPYEEFPSVGRFEGDRFDPRTWKPQTPTTAYLELRADDAFWAARKLMAFTDDLIRAAVHTGQFSDPAAEQHLASVLMKRRDKIGRTYLPAVNPIVDPRLDDGGHLTFGNAAVSAGFAQAPAGYRATWSHLDNATGETTRIGETESTTTSMNAPPNLTAPAGSYIEVAISADDQAHPTWREPVRTFFRRTTSGWTLVGLERLPETLSPELAAQLSEQP